MNPSHGGLGPFARGVMLFVFLLAFAGAVLLGGLASLVLTLSAATARLFARVLPRRGAARTPAAASDLVIDGSYVVIDDPRARAGKRSAGA